MTSPTPPSDNEPRFSAPPPGTPHSAPQAGPGAPTPPQYQPAPGAPIPPQYLSAQGAPTQPPYPPAQGAPGHSGPLPKPGPGEPFDGAWDPSVLTRPLYGASFGAAISRFWRNYVNFSGRASRSEYWWAVLFINLGFLVGIVIGVAGGAAAEPGTNDSPLVAIGGLLIFAFFLAVIVPILSLSWRRLHDANLAGPLYFLNFIPYLGSLVVLVLMLLPSQVAGRRFDR